MTRGILAILILGMVGSTLAAPEVPAHLARLDSLLACSDYEAVLACGDSLAPLDKMDEALILDRMVHAAYRSRHVMEDRFPEMARRAVRLKEETRGPDGPETAISLLQMGNLMLRRWELEEARIALERAVEIFDVAGDEHVRNRALSLVGLGLTHKREGDRHGARDIYLRALALQEEHLSPDDPAIASTLNNLGTVNIELGDYRQTLAYHRRALAIREKALGPDHEWVGETLNNLSSVLGYLGEYEESLAAQERAVRILTDRLGPDHQRTWTVRLNLGLTYLEMGRYAGTIPIFEDVLARFEERYGQEYYQNCYILDAMAAAYTGLGQHEEALAHYQRSLAIAIALYGKDNLDTADTLTLVGGALADLGRFNEAAGRLEESLKIREAAMAGDDAILCPLLNQLAEVNVRRGAFVKAEKFARRSMAIGEAELGWDHPYLSVARLRLGQAVGGRGRDHEALNLACLAERSSRSHLFKTMRVLSESRALDYAASRTTGLDLASSLVEGTGRVAQVWDEVIRSRGMVLDEYTRRNRDLRQDLDPELRALADSSRIVRERLANLTLRGAGWEDPAEYSAMLRQAEEDFERVERRLMVNQAHGRRRALQATGLKQVQHHLPSGWALVGYTLHDETYRAFIQPVDGVEPVAVNLGPAEAIDQAVRDWRWEIRYGAETGARRGIVQISGDAQVRRANYLEVARALRRLIWDPISGACGEAEGIFLVPAGNLNLVNFAALVDDDGRFLVEGETLLHLLPDERTLCLPESGAPGSGLLAVGGPDFGADPDPDMMGMIFGDLPMTRDEVDRVGDIWLEWDRKRIILKGAEATERAVKENAEGHAVLHFATHGFFQTEERETALSRWNHALTHSGLALAGANRGNSEGEDGLLTAQEVAALDLEGVRWAVLSACETGLGAVDQRGEGVHGLRRVFSLAGTRTVIMSLWAVPDEWTRIWMENLYHSRWRQGRSTARAMREASLRTLAHRRERDLSDHPYFWAGFVAAGDWR